MNATTLLCCRFWVEQLVVGPGEVSSCYGELTVSPASMSVGQQLATTAMLRAASSVEATSVPVAIDIVRIYHASLDALSYLLADVQVTANMTGNASPPVTALLICTHTAHREQFRSQRTLELIFRNIPSHYRPAVYSVPGMCPRCGGSAPAEQFRYYGHTFCSELCYDQFSCTQKYIF